MILRLVGLLLLSLGLIGADFYTPRIEGYRVWIGEDETVDWIDVCCEHNEDLQLVWADYSPIEKVEIQRIDRGLTTILITKKYSRWIMTGPLSPYEEWMVTRIDPQ